MAMKTRAGLMALAGWISVQLPGLRAQEASHNACHRPLAGSAVPEPEDLRSQNGELTADLRIRNEIEADGSLRYCYTTADGRESPNLRVNPGDLLILNLENELIDPADKAAGRHHAHGATRNDDPCTSGL